MIVLHITKNESNNCLLFAEQLHAVHSTFYTFMLLQHVKKQLGFLSMQHHQYFLVIKEQRDYYLIKTIDSCKQSILQFLCTLFVPIKYNVLFLHKNVL